ncbi:MAG: signal peptidase II [Clostridia bacterium]|nr:signal peptidase II [Clostridia bacterium]
MFVWILLIIAFVYLDQITKYLAVIFLKALDTFPLIQDVFHLTYVENRGAAFGMLSNHRWVFMIISTVGIIALSIYMFYNRRESKLQNTALSMIIAGGIGNMIDRIALGYVVDFFDFTLINFAVFNVADVFVCVGCGLEVLYMLILLVKSYKETKAESCAKSPSPEENPDKDQQTQ